jgi:hypothetical protein
MNIYSASAHLALTGLVGEVGLVAYRMPVSLNVRLRAILNAADDPFTRHWWSAVERSDVPTLKSLLQRPELRRMSSRELASLANGLSGRPTELSQLLNMAYDQRQSEPIHNGYFIRCAVTDAFGIQVGSMLVVNGSRCQVKYLIAGSPSEPEVWAIASPSPANYFLLPFRLTSSQNDVHSTPSAAANFSTVAQPGSRRPCSILAMPNTFIPASSARAACDSPASSRNRFNAAAKPVPRCFFPISSSRSGP